MAYFNLVLLFNGLIKTDIDKKNKKLYLISEGVSEKQKLKFSSTQLDPATSLVQCFLHPIKREILLVFIACKGLLDVFYTDLKSSFCKEIKLALNY